MEDMEEIIKQLESLRDICNARSEVFVGYAKIVWAGYGRTVSDAIELLKEQEPVKPLAQADDTFECSCGAIVGWDGR